jgi:hypothetical protein
MFGTRVRTLIALVVTIAGLTVATPASAEWFVDLHLGGAFTEKHDVDTQFPGGVVSALDVSFNNSFTAACAGATGSRSTLVRSTSASASISRTSRRTSGGSQLSSAATFASTEYSTTSISRSG